MVPLMRSLFRILVLAGALALVGGGAATEVQAAGQSTSRPPSSGLAASSAGSGLAYSTASAAVAQPQPPAGSCHARGHGVLSLPDPRCTPGALNPAVTQANIGQTICKSGWTSSVRPSESVTETEKRGSMAAYGDSYPLADYEYDHLVSLELGGAVNDPRNLWPEPGASFNPKDQVENELNAEVCNGKMSLATAQKDIATDWLHVPGTTPGREAGSAPPGSTTGTSPGGSTRSATCTVTASYNTKYRDWDVYVHSNQPSSTVTVTDTGGQSASYHTDSSGYADVFLKAPFSTAGEHLTAHAGPATCTTTL
jgi:hypothetical protein